MLRIGVIGFGGRIRSMIVLLRAFKEDFKVVAVADPRTEEVKAELEEDKHTDARLYADADEMLEREKLDGAMIGTRCSLHARMGAKVLRRHIPLFLEKPIATNMEDLRALAEAGRKARSQTVVSFPLRVTPLVQCAKEIIGSGKLGTVEHVQAWNNVPYGACYFQYWYRDENETGGLFLQKATHDFDYINYLVGIEPRWISAVKSKRIFKGDKPAGLYCRDCADLEKCPDGPYQAFFSRADAKEVDRESGSQCCYARDTGNEDSGSALIEYETGMHAAYSQNFFARKAAGARGARLFGYKGTLEFDWYTDELKVFMHHTPRVETYKFNSAAMPHGGGDTVLLKSFLDVMQGRAASVSPLEAGLLSVLMCLKAKESAQTRTFQQVDMKELETKSGAPAKNQKAKGGVKAKKT